MCLAVPMKVEQIEGDPDDFTQDQIAVVNMDGVSRKIRLDVVDRWPEVGDYVIVHAGFAINQLTAEDAAETWRVIEALDIESDPEGAIEGAGA